MKRNLVRQLSGISGDSSNADTNKQIRTKQIMPIQKFDSRRFSLHKIQSKVVDVLEDSEEQKSSHQKVDEELARVNVINDMLNWSDTTMKKLLDSLDVPRHEIETDYEEIKTRMDLLWGDTKRYKDQSNLVMEDMLDSLNNDSVSSDLLEEVQLNPELREAIQKAAFVRIPRQLENLFLTMQMMIQSMRRGVPPSGEEEQRVFAQTQGVIKTCSAVQNVLFCTPPERIKQNEDTFSSLLPIAIDNAPAPPLSSTRKATSRALSIRRSIETKYVMDRDDSKIGPIDAADRGPRLDEGSLQTGPVNFALNPKAVLSSQRKKCTISKRILTTNMSTQTEFFLTDPIGEVSGLKLMKTHSDYRIKAARKLSVTSSGSIDSGTSPSTIEIKPVKSEIPEIQVNSTDSIPSNESACTSDAVQALAEEEKESSPSASSILAPITEVMPVAYTEPPPAAAETSNKTKTSKESVRQKKPSSAKGSRSIAHNTQLQIKSGEILRSSQLGEDEALQLISQLNSCGSSATLSNEQLLELISVDNILALHTYLLMKINELDVKRNNKRSTSPKRISTKVSSNLPSECLRRLNIQEESSANFPSCADIDDSIRNNFTDTPMTDTLTDDPSSRGIRSHPPMKVSFFDEGTSSVEMLQAQVPTSVALFDPIIIPPLLKMNKDTSTDNLLAASALIIKPIGKSKRSRQIGASTSHNGLKIEAKKITSTTANLTSLNYPLRLSINKGLNLPDIESLTKEIGSISDTSESDLQIATDALQVGFEPEVPNSLEYLYKSLLNVDSTKVLDESLYLNTELRQHQTVSNIFDSINNELMKLHASSIDLQALFDRAEASAKSVFHAYHVAEQQGQQVIHMATEEFSKRLGLLEVSLMVFDVNLVEFRVVFEAINIQNAFMLTKLVNTNKSFEKAFAEFTYCQSKSVEFKKKINILFEFATEYKLKAQASSSSAPIQSHDVHKQLIALKREREGLKVALECSYKEVDKLEKELFDMILEKDRTPSALLFFCALNDAATIDSLQELLAELKKLKDFVDCKIQMDYLDLRKRLQVCITSTCCIDKFLYTYKNMLRDWKKKSLSILEKRNFTEDENCMNTIGNQSITKSNDHLLLRGQLKSLVSKR